MLLTIDIGNTNTVFALFKGPQILKSWRIVTQAGKSADEYAVFFFGLKSHEGYQEGVKDIIISSVVPETHIHITQFCKTYLNLDPVFVSKNHINMPINIERPEDVGADRLVNAVAVLAHYQAPAIVLDFGTATTFDVIGIDKTSGEGTYEGGAIAPGINLSMSALAQAASKLPKVSISKPPASIGKNTADAMKSGLYWGYVGLIDGILQRLCLEISDNKKPLIIATGGLAQTFKDDIPLIEIIDNDLTLKGLFAIYQSLKH